MCGKSDSDDNMKTAPSNGKFDYFRLYIWDRIVEEVIKNSARPADVDESTWTKDYSSLIAKMRFCANGEGHLRRVMVKATKEKPDIAVLIEMPGTSCKANLLAGYWVIHHKEVDAAQNVLILARKDRFAEPVLRSESDRRVLSCDVRSRDSDASLIHLVAVHAPSSSKAADLERLGAQLEGPRVFSGCLGVKVLRGA